MSSINVKHLKYKINYQDTKYFVPNQPSLEVKTVSSVSRVTRQNKSQTLNHGIFKLTISEQVLFGKNSALVNFENTEKNVSKITVKTACAEKTILTNQVFRSNNALIWTIIGKML